MVVALAETVEEAPASQADTLPMKKKNDSIALPDAEGLDQPRTKEHTERDEAKGAGSPHRIILRQGLPSKELLETILFHLRGGDAHQRAVAFYLVDFDKREEYKLHTCPTTAHFAQARLGLTLREAQELLRVGRKLEILEELDEAFARGAIGWCKLREISRIATPETEWAWLLYAKSHNMREIEHAVRRKKEGDPPPKAGEGEGGALQTFLNVTYRLTPKAKLAWETAFEKVSSEFPKGTSNDAIFMYIAELLLRTARDPEREAKLAPIYTIVFQVGPDGGAGRIQRGANGDPSEGHLRDRGEGARHRGSSARRRRGEGHTPGRARYRPEGGARWTCDPRHALCGRPREPPLRDLQGEGDPYTVITSIRARWVGRPCSRVSWGPAVSAMGSSTQA